MRKYIHHFDRVFLSWTQKLPRGLTPLMRGASTLGQPAFTVGAAAGTIGYGLALGQLRLAMLGAIAIATLVVCSILKIFLRRARPSNDYVQSMLIQTFSFPSGHAAGSLVSFGLIGYLLTAQASWGIWVFIAILGLCWLIGVSRVYLGAHYPTDVAGGWLVGGIGLLVIMLTGISTS